MARVWLGEDDPQRDLTGGDGEGEGNDYLAGTDEPGRLARGGVVAPRCWGSKVGGISRAARSLWHRVSLSRAPPSQRFMSIACAPLQAALISSFGHFG